MKKAFKTFVSTVAMLIALCLALSIAACGGTKVTSIELSDATISMYIGDTYTLEYLVYPQSAANETATWSSFPTSVATVSNTGLVTGVAEGTAQVKVSVGDVSATCTVNVIDKSKQAVNVRGVSLSQATLSFDSKDAESVQLIASVTPDNATDQSVTWSSGNESVATVDQDGWVKPVGGGTTKITVRTNNLGYSASCAVSVGGEAAESSLYVAKVDSLEGRQKEDANDDDYFIMGMDASEVLSIEEARAATSYTLNGETVSKDAEVAYRDFDGNEADVFQVLKDAGITDIRVRIWNNPTDSTDGTGNTYGGGNCDVDNAIAIAKRCQAVGLGMIVDFHYSDFWADPGKQKAPKAWSSYTVSQMETAIYNFTKDSLQSILEGSEDEDGNSVKITMVQVGNETNGAMCGATEMTTVANYMASGAKGVREATGELSEGGARVAVHFTNASYGQWGGYASTLYSQSVDYDVFGVSWYPYYSSHGELSDCTSQLTTIHNTYGKEVMVLETAYAFSYDDYDGTGNTQLETTTQPVTVQGQTSAVRTVIQGIADLKDSSGTYFGRGVCYWGGTWISASTSTDGNTNRALCMEHGCGWATSYAKDYDSDAPTSSAGGTQVDNQTFFDSEGYPLESLNVFNYVFDGHTTGLSVDYSDDLDIYCTVGEGSIELPTTVSVILNDGSTQTTSVSWFVEQTDLDQWINEVGTYTVEGTTDYGGTLIKCTIWVQFPNILTNASFEDNEDGTQNATGWTLNYTTHTSTEKPSSLELYVSNNSQNAVMGTNSYHFWDWETVEFTLEQSITVSDLSDYGSGYYGCSFNVAGGDGDASTTKIYAYITVTTSSGATTYSIANSNCTGEYATLDGWQQWTRTSVSGVYIDLSDVTSITVGISVYATLASGTDGPWGNIDNCQFYFEGTSIS